MQILFLNFSFDCLIVGLLLERSPAKQLGAQMINSGPVNYLFNCYTDDVSLVSLSLTFLERPDGLCFQDLSGPGSHHQVSAHAFKNRSSEPETLKPFPHCRNHFDPMVAFLHLPYYYETSWTTHCCGCFTKTLVENFPKPTNQKPDPSWTFSSATGLW